MSMDTTFKTNNEKRSLFSITTQSVDHKCHQVMKMFLPSEQIWIFQLVFTLVSASTNLLYEFFDIDESKYFCNYDGSR